MNKSSLAITYQNEVSNTTNTVTGKQAETLTLLMKNGKDGVDVFNFRGGPAFRLAAYIHNLKKQGLAIQTQLIPHDGGHHAKYTLLSRVSIVSSIPNEALRK